MQSGQAGAQMTAALDRLGRQRPLTMFADWTDRIAAGEVPQAPRRPQGIERNVVITEWDWADPKAYLHDVVSTDRRNPRVNANGLIYGSLELSADYLPVLDPTTNAASKVPLTVRDPNTPIGEPAADDAPSAYWGDEAIWTSKNNVHNPMIDDKGRVWITSTVRPPDNPDVCKAGSSHPSAKLFPLPRSGRQLAMYDPKTEKLTHISTCFSTHHLHVRRGREQHAVDERRRPGGRLARHEDVRRDGRRGEVAGLDRARSSTRTATASATSTRSRTSRSIRRRTSASMPDSTPSRPRPTDRSGDRRSASRAAIVRLTPGAHPPATALAEYYEPPYNNPKATVQGFSPRGVDVDRNGVVWVALASGHMASFDRRKCNGPLNGPTATGQHCPEGWTLYQEPMPQFKGVTDGGSVEASYYTWVDQFDTLGLGKNTPINTGNASEGLLALKDGKWVDPARAVPDRLLHQVDGRSHRRPERGLEGPRPLGDREHARAVPHGSREGNDEQGDALSAEARSAREVIHSRGDAAEDT